MISMIKATCLFFFLRQEMACSRKWVSNTGAETHSHNLRSWNFNYSHIQNFRAWRLLPILYFGSVSSPSSVCENWKGYVVKHNYVTQLSIPTLAQIQRHRLKFIKNHIKTPTCFGLQPSSGSYNFLAKVTII